MLPYFDIARFKLGPLTVYTWGFVVSIGFAVAIWIAYRRARRFGLDGNRIFDLAFWILVAAFIGARLGHVFFYEWNYYSQHVREIIRIDQGGLSSFGGFIGAAVAFLLYTIKRHPERLPAQAGSEEPALSLSKGSHTMHDSRDSSPSAQNDGLRWRYADLLMFAWPLGQGIGRIGCFLTHMHPGRLSVLPWAVQYPDGSRLDMGLIESVLLLSYGGIVWIVTRHKKIFAGFYLVSGMVFYGGARLVLDFFRAADLPMSDTRYFGLTPAQYGSIVLVLVGLYLMYACRRAFRAIS